MPATGTGDQTVARQPPGDLRAHGRTAENLRRQGACIRGPAVPHAARRVRTCNWAGAQRNLRECPVEQLRVRLDAYSSEPPLA